MATGTRFSFFLSALPLLFLPLCVSAQSAAIPGTTNPCLRVIYRLDYKLDSTVATPKSEQTLLRIATGTSCFQSKPEYIRDSVYASLSDLPEKERTQKSLDAWMKAGKTQLNYSIFKEPAKNLVFYHDKIGTIDYQYQEPVPLFYWQITPTTQQVAGYACQQAFTTFGGRRFEAWFTRDLPVSDGPYKFYGLPGLIVKVRDTHDNYVFELLSLESHPQSFVLSTTSSAPLIGKAKFNQTKRNDELTLLDQMASWGNQIPESMRAGYLAKLKRQNNPLELK